MTVETATYISGLNASYPAEDEVGTLHEGNDHLRLIKSTIKSTFPNVTGAVTRTHTELNVAPLPLAGGEMAGDVDFANNDLGGLKTATFEGVVTVTSSSGTAAVNWNNGLKQKITLTENTTFAFTAPPGPTSGLVLEVVQNASAAKTLTWPVGVEWPGSSTPTMTSALSRVDIYVFYYNGTTYFGSAAQNYNLS
jgi:hypothetical protein